VCWAREFWKSHPFWHETGYRRCPHGAQALPTRSAGVAHTERMDSRGRSLARFVLQSQKALFRGGLWRNKFCCHGGIFDSEDFRRSGRVAPLALLGRHSGQLGLSLLASLVTFRNVRPASITAPQQRVVVRRRGVRVLRFALAGGVVSSYG
jgi:hypothetical protein